jgi:hypothetical protein
MADKGAPGHRSRGGTDNRPKPSGAGDGCAAASASVPRLWPASTIVCIGGGPSLTPDDVTLCRNRARVIAINDAYRLAPWADVLYAADSKWWRYHKGVPSFHGLKFSLQPDASQWPGVVVLRNTGCDGLERDPSGLKTGLNSGYQAVNLAVHLGAARILLLGYDMQAIHGTKTHWFGEHPPAIRCGSPYAGFQAKFPLLVKPLADLGVEVVNCSRETALTCFPRLPIDHALEGARIEVAS